METQAQAVFSHRALILKQFKEYYIYGDKYCCEVRVLVFIFRDKKSQNDEKVF
jgi:hypothetical protein